MYYSPFNQFQNYSIKQESITRVTGEEGAKAYQMAPNSSAALFDGNEDIFYLKTTDGAGFPTIRKFKFEEIQEKAPEPGEGSDYITREEFEQFREEMRTYGEQYIQKSAETEQHRTESGNHRTSKAGNERRAGGFDVFQMAQNFNGRRKRGGIHAGKPARKEPGRALERVEA